MHGYNNSLDEAVRRTAMIAFDLDFDGATFLFAWPAQAGMFSYGGDRERARIAAPFLVEMLKLIAFDLPDVKLHIIAHSTGAEIALSALAELASRSPIASHPKFGELILSHADVNPARLGRVMSNIKTLCKRLSEGESLSSICRDEHMPSKGTVLGWANDLSHPISDHYARAREIGWHSLADELFDIADDSSNDWIDRETARGTIRVVDQECVQRAKLRVEARQWMLSKMLPKVYGKQVDDRPAGHDGLFVEVLKLVTGRKVLPGQEPPPAIELKATEIKS